MLYEHNYLNPMLVIERALAIKKSHQVGNPIPKTKLKLSCCWRPPPEGFLKLNVDGAMFFNLQKIGIGAILRNSNGDAIMVASILENDFPNLESIKSLTIL